MIPAIQKALLTLTMVLSPALARTSDMTMMLPLMVSPVMLAGFVLAVILIVNDARYMKTGHLVTVALLVVAVVINTLVALVCLTYIGSSYSTVAVVYCVFYVLFMGAAVAGIQAFREIPVHPDDQPPQ